jgi:predicted nucleic acid-binding protein
VLIDERKGRKIARSIYGLNVVGTARILVEAKHRGILLHVGDTLTKMRDAGYWIHEEIVAAAKKAAGEA